MRTAYLGIADRGRLTAWWPERLETCRFLERRLLRRPREVCFWAVLSSDDASQITECLRLGELDSALRLLQQTDAEIGRILPPAVETFCRA